MAVEWGKPKISKQNGKEQYDIKGTKLLISKKN